MTAVYKVVMPEYSKRASINRRNASRGACPESLLGSRRDDDFSLQMELDMSSWNPDLYLQFKEERTQPARDLAARISLDKPKQIVDLGCGPGNSTQVLRDRWPDADVLGVDNSPEMIEKARATCLQGSWLLADLRDWNPEDSWDIVFSCATLQWIPNHERLIPKVFSLVKAEGVLAVQLPANQEAPLHLALLEVARRKEWKDLTSGCEDLIVYRSPGFYYDILSPISPGVFFWKTTYYHVLADHQGLIDWYSSTGMKTYLERLPGETQKESFRTQVLEACRDSYPAQKDGRILYPFDRLFFIAYKK
jgi:trans-aconitate 2-methyltransferase